METGILEGNAENRPKYDVTWMIMLLWLQWLTTDSAVHTAQKIVTSNVKQAAMHSTAYGTAIPAGCWRMNIWINHGTTYICCRCRWCGVSWHQGRSIHMAVKFKV